MMKKEEENIPEVDESLLTEEQKQAMEAERKVPWGWLIFMGVVLTLIVACVIVVLCLK